MADQQGSFGGCAVRWVGGLHRGNRSHPPLVFDAKTV